MHVARSATRHARYRLGQHESTQMHYTDGGECPLFPLEASSGFGSTAIQSTSVRALLDVGRRSEAAKLLHEVTYSRIQPSRLPRALNKQGLVLWVRHVCRYACLMYTGSQVSPLLGKERHDAWYLFIFESPFDMAPLPPDEVATGLYGSARRWCPGLGQANWDMGSCSCSLL
jgi:hypothetical protein